MAFQTYRLGVLDSIKSSDRFIARVLRERDACNFAVSYVMSEEHGVYPGGYPVVRLFRDTFSDGECVSSVIVRSFYPNPYDRSKVEELEVGNVRH